MDIVLSWSVTHVHLYFLSNSDERGDLRYKLLLARTDGSEPTSSPVLQTWRNRYT